MTTAMNCDPSKPHGMYHAQARLPIWPGYHLCATITTGRYFVTKVEHTRSLPFRVALPFAAIAVVKGARRNAPRFSTMRRWCAHI